jgi:hypothetical protein
MAVAPHRMNYDISHTPARSVSTAYSDPKT